MCGIAGFAGKLRDDEGQQTLRAMNASQCHRGPDGSGIWQEDGVGLAHARLAIIDLMTGDQPMVSADGRYAVILNGEIYNFRALRKELTAIGYAFKTDSDTEVIPAALDAWGLSTGLTKLRGMFAFALYDRKEHTLTLARDRFGIKPLYCARLSTVILFASEMKAILATGRVDSAADAAGIVDFLTLGATVSPHTCWTAIEEMVPGTWTVFDAQLKRTTGRFADLADCQPQLRGTDEELLDRVEHVLLDSCEQHLESDVPVGAFLSGGIDSSLLVSMLSRFRPGLDTFHVKFSEAAYDESAFARSVAEHCGTRHHEVFLPSHEGSLDRLRLMLEQWDQPFGDSSAIPTWLISEKISQHVKVAISGDGGDEVFGGYERYKTVRLLERIGRIPGAGAAVTGVSSIVRQVAPDLGRQGRKLAALSQYGRARQMVELHTYLGPSDLTSLLAPEVARALAAAGPSESRTVPAAVESIEDPTERLIRFELHSMLHADYLRKVDVASSAHGLEVRTPFLDTEVAAVGLRLPLDLRVGGGQLKRALRLIAARYLPASVVEKPKWGFGLPFDTWLAPSETKGIRGYLMGAESRSRDWLHKPAVDALVTAFERGSDRRDLSRYQVYQRVFMLISLESWLRRWKPSLVAAAA